MRQRKTLVQSAGDQIRRAQKALTLMNLLLHTVVSDITGKTGLCILSAIMAGERDPKKLASHRDRRCAASVADIEAALTGNYQPDHLFCLKQSLGLWEYYQRLIADCDVEIEALLRRTIQCRGDLAPDARLEQRSRGGKTSTKVPLAALVTKVSGVDLSLIPGFSDLSACQLLSEIGVDMSAWKTPNRFAAWLRLAPGCRITGGRKLTIRRQPTRSHAAEIFRMAAVNAGRTSTSLGAFYRRMKARNGPKAAVGALAHKLARIVYTLLKYKRAYFAEGMEADEEAARQRAIQRLRKKAKRLGLSFASPDSDAKAA
jgi:hypothetical protein